MAARRRVVFASGNARVHSKEAIRHGVRQEAPARERISHACGVHFYPVEYVTRVNLGEYQVRVKPDGADNTDPRNVEALLEIKCPHSKNMRNEIGSRMRLHARQCLLELVAFPQAAFLIFAVLNYAPAEEVSHHHYDSVLHRLDRTRAVSALDELRAAGLLADFAEDVPNADVNAILGRMVASAVQLPKVSKMGTATAMKLLPELFRKVPAHLVDYIAKDFRSDDDVLEDCSKIAALGDHCVDGVPASEFPRYFLRFSGRVALCRLCQQHLPDEADAILRRCCLKPTHARGALSWLRYQDPSLSADAIFRIARQEQNQSRDAPQPPLRRRIAPF